MTKNPFWQGETYAIVKAMRAAGNREGVIALWKESVANWATYNTGADAEAVKAWLPHWHPRDAYTAEELAPLWPALAIAVGHTVHWPPVLKSARRLEFELDYAGLPFVTFNGQKYYIVERLHYWSKEATKDEIERMVNA